mmetsp:Transcript_2117/g.5660  ORF Transcript_2117/g.5660 Transcript_2117/m.5660 type:complete len:305 (+) Transcript_2117:403-1317(+)
MNRSDREVRIAHFLRQPVHLLLRVAEDDGLCDRERVVEVAEGVELPLLALDRHEELLDTVERQLVALDQDPERVVHELVGHLEDLVRHGGGDEDHLGRWGKVTVDVVDLLLEATVQHLVRLVQNEHLDLAGAEVPLLDHVEHAPWRARHDVDARLEGVDVVRDPLAANAAVDLHVQVIAEGQAHLLALLRELSRGREEEHLRVAFLRVYGLQRPQAEHARFPGAALRLHDHVAALEDGEDGALLHRGGPLEAVGVDAPKQVLLQTQGVKRGKYLDILGRLEDQAFVVRRLGHGALHCSRPARRP